MPGASSADHPDPQELRERVLRGKYRIPFYMSTDCENLLKKFLILNPSKRGTLEVSPGPAHAAPHTLPGILVCSTLEGSPAPGSTPKA